MSINVLYDIVDANHNDGYLSSRKKSFNDFVEARNFVARLNMRTPKHRIIGTPVIELDVQSPDAQLLEIA
jgi:hypothetical protein